MSANITLTYPPLLEAILEIQWKLNEIGQGVFVDNEFEVAHIRLANKLEPEFPYIESLPVVEVPSQITARVPRYRYRKAQNEWPLIQLGPGIATLNFTTPYSWDTFLDTSKLFMDSLHAAYTQTELELTRIQLRYVNFEPFDFTNDNVLGFIETKLHTSLQFPEGIIRSDTTKVPPTSVTFSSQFQLAEPPGSLGTLRITTGTLNLQDSPETKAIVWEIIVHSMGETLPQLSTRRPENTLNWLKNAHDTIEQWFFTLIDGELLRKYK